MSTVGGKSAASVWTSSAARLRDALSLWLAGVDEAQLRRAVEAWHATVRASRQPDDEDELDGDAA